MVFRVLLALTTLLGFPITITTTVDVYKHTQRNTLSLGVEHVRLYTRAPVNGTQKVVTLSLWLKRIVPTASGSNQSSTPYSQLATLEGFGWVEDLASLNNHIYGHLLTTVDIHTWRPQLLLETPMDSGPVEAVHHPATWTVGGPPIDPPWSHIRPFFFAFPLSGAQAAVQCFKVFESTHPDFKAITCPSAADASLCHRLAPPSHFTPSRPALWATLVPLRSMGVPGTGWEQHMVQSAARLHHHIAYLRTVGVSGALLYVDRLTAGGLEPHVRGLLRDGFLVFVAWDEIERIQYNYDQALVYSHALLGLSGCDANLWLATTDIDELLYNAYGKLWPDMFACLVRSAGGSEGGSTAATGAGEEAPPDAGLFRLARVDIMASTAAPGDEAAWWAGQEPAPTQQQGRGGPGRAVGRRMTASRRTVTVRHPLEMYDRIAAAPFDRREGKFVACPARRIVAVWVHGALPLGGSQHEADPSCALVLHMPNFWVQRTGAGNASGFEAFRMRMGRSGAEGRRAL